MLQVENPVVLDLPLHNPPNYDSEAYWYFHADDGSDAQDETHYCLDLQRRLEEEKKRRIAKGEWNETCEEHFQWLIGRLTIKSQEKVLKSSPVLWRWKMMRTSFLAT